MAPVSRLEAHFKETSRLSEAVWSALVEREGSQWLIRAVYRLSKVKQTALTKFLSQESVDTWLAGGLRNDGSRSASLPAASRLDVPRLYVYPIQSRAQAVLVGASHQTPTSQRLWRLFTGMAQAAASNASTETLLPDLQTELQYDMPRALDRALMNFVNKITMQGGWLAIRRGETFEIQAQWNDPRDLGITIPIESSSLLRHMNRTLADISAQRGQPEWDELPQGIRKPETKYWICLPLVVGHRLIGAVALWSATKFPAAEWQRLRELARQASPAIEVIITFSELTGHLRRLAMLNEFALTISSAQNLDQVARRVFGLLARSLGTELISLYLPSADGRLLREFSNRDGKFSAQSSALAGHKVLPFLKESRTLRLSDTQSILKPIHPGVRSGLMVPLKYRGQTIGLLSLESTHPDAFGLYDEHLMVVIASHLAGLVEYTRLREEAEARARNLGLIHEVVQQVIGLSDSGEVVQITADLLAQYFAYELAGVVLVDDNLDPSIVGIGGSKAGVMQGAFAKGSFSLIDGITGHVLSTGESVFANDAGRHDLYKPLKDWKAGAEMCVALRDGDRVLGFIDVESSRPFAFSNNDLLAMESLAGVLASVVTNSSQYQRQQETVRQLRAAQVELRARMVTQQETESRLIQAAKLAAVGEMAAGIAHELNNPLTTVTGFTELLLEETPQGAVHRDDMELILREAKRARDVVRRLLDFARQGEQIRARADLNEVVTDVLTLMHHFIHTSGVQLETDISPDLPWVLIDTNQMKQVILNLVHNALQAMPTGGRLEIATALMKKDNRDWVTISIRDYGVGIEPRNLERIFEPFFTTKGNRGGTGLGLSVTYGIVTDHGGTIEVVSQLGSGSTFTVWLPV